MSKRKIVLAFSGGLDTSYALVSLREQGWEVLTANIDTGGLHSGEADVVRKRAEELGAAQHFVIDAREELYSRVITYAIKANYLRNGGYPSCVGAERLVQAEKVVQAAIDNGADAVAHGSTGAGADHVRYDSVIRALAPQMEIVTPIRDERLTREYERDYLRERGFETPEKVTTYSINEGLIGTSIGGKETYGSWDYLPEDAWTYTKSIAEAPEDGVELILGFTKGRSSRRPRPTARRSRAPARTRPTTRSCARSTCSPPSTASAAASTWVPRWSATSPGSASRPPACSR